MIVAPSVVSMTMAALCYLTILAELQDQDFEEEEEVAHQDIEEEEEVVAHQDMMDEEEVAEMTEPREEHSLDGSGHSHVSCLLFVPRQVEKHLVVALRLQWVFPPLCIY